MKYIDSNLIQKALDWAYDKALEGGGPLDSAWDLAREYSEGPGTLEDKVDRFVRWQTTKASTTGFVTGLGGLLTMPFTIPANLGSVVYIQVRMAATIAIMAGRDPKSDQTRTLVFLALVGNSLTQVLKELGIEIGKKMATALVEKISGAVLTKINQAVGFRLLTKFGQRGVINLGRAIPLAGGFVGATFDFLSTRAVAKAAKKLFLE